MLYRMKEKAEQEALLLAGEKEHEKQDLADMEKEIKQVQENIEKEVISVLHTTIYCQTYRSVKPFYNIPDSQEKRACEERCFREY